MATRRELPRCGAAMSGLSLVELMVSMALGLLLCAGMVGAYLGAKRHFFYEEQMARMQENGRYALRLLSRELGMAGFLGGVPSMAGVAPGSVASDCSIEDWALDAADPLEVVNDFDGRLPPVSLQSTPLTCLEDAAIVPHTDLVSVKRTAAQPSLYRGVPAAALPASTTQSWYLRTVSGSPAGWEMLLPTDLREPRRALPTDSYWQASTRIFYIRTYSEAGSERENLPTLCMETLAGDGMTSRCLVEGVEDLQLEFGVDTDGDGAPNRYLSAPGSSEMDRIVTVKIHLLLRSIATLAGHRDDKTYRLGRKTLLPTGDAYLRGVFSSTVLLRNRAKPIG